jgi:phosphomannomutase
VACEVIPYRRPKDRLGEQVRDERAHFGVEVDDDGERLRLLDERGREVPDERLFLLVARHLLAERPKGAIVVEEDVGAETSREIAALVGRVIGSDSRRAEMHRSMWENGAILGGPGRRFWYRSEEGHCSADGLVTLTLLLKLLSQSDRPLSEVLDADAAPR